MKAQPTSLQPTKWFSSSITDSEHRLDRPGDIDQGLHLLKELERPPLNNRDNYFLNNRNKQGKLHLCFSWSSKRLLQHQPHNSSQFHMRLTDLPFYKILHKNNYQKWSTCSMMTMTRPLEQLITQKNPQVKQQSPQHQFHNHSILPWKIPTCHSSHRRGPLTRSSLWSLDEFGNITRPHSHWDGSPWTGYGPHFKKFHYAYLTSQQRHRDVQGQGKEAGESDTTQGSDTEESADEEKTNVPVYKQGMSRMELKALDREIPWRKILEMPDSYIDKFLEAIIKEAEPWSSWQSVEPISDREAQEILRHPDKKRRVLKSRACYRDKALGQGELRPKCRVVALGHLDPDLPVLSRNSATPGRLAEHCLYAMIVAGHNRQLFNTTMAWTAWSGDAATAFLQGEQQRQEPLYLLPPSDGLIARTNTWQHRLYRVRGNIYGLANAPATWNKEVEKRLTALHYQRHSFDKQLFYKVLDGHVVSMVVIYVDDFIGVQS